MTIARVALPVAVGDLFDYWVPEGLGVGPGSIVRVRLAGRALAGVVVETVEGTDIPPERLVPVSERVGGFGDLPADLIDLARFVSGYYHEPLGQVLAQMLPPLSTGQREPRRPDLPASALRFSPAGLEAIPPRLRRAPRERALFERWQREPTGIVGQAIVAGTAGADRAIVRRWLAAGWVEPFAVDDAPVLQPLNGDQRRAVDAIAGETPGFQAHLLHGITGSGKTEVYLAAAAAAIDSGAQVLLLVPEINLTPQLEARVAAALRGRRLATLHSGLPAGARRAHWLAAAAGEADLVIGTRLAVFAPLPRLGLVVVDEEHDPSYKQQDLVRYHARDVAVWRARQRGVPIVLGTATPALETLHQARRGRYRTLPLPVRAASGAELPAVRLVPDRQESDAAGIGAELREAIGARLARGEQSLIFINRRGYAPSLLCSACGWQAGCPRCSVRLVVHRDGSALRCHHCGHSERLPTRCPDCGNVDLLPLGHGTQRLEQALVERFPAARIARIDRDSTRRRGAFAAVREATAAGDVDILVGTQMLAKGHDFPRITLVGVLGADNALYSADFRATERLAALLFQVAGRAGRAELRGEVLVQTNFPRHPLFEALLGHDWALLADALLEERRAAGLPPFGHLALLAAEATERAHLDRFLDAAHACGCEVRDAAGVDVDVFAPVPAALARRAGHERAQVLVRADNRGALQRFLRPWHERLLELPDRRVRWALDVDPAACA